MSVEHYRIVFIFDERVYGHLISEGSFMSKVSYELDGIKYEVFIENTDFEIIEDIQIEIEEE